MSPKGYSIKLSPLEFMILLRGYQSEKVGISGYDLINELNKATVGLWTAKSGTIYPILTRMKQKNLIAIFDVRSELGPSKKVYKVTDLAKEVIEAMVVDNFKPELIFFENYLDFVVNTLMKISHRNPESKVNLEEVKTALGLFQVTIENMQEILENAIVDQEKIENDVRVCMKCNGEIDNLEANFCPNCGNKLDE
ncbi:hypothetical protein GF325_08225 [Candidatus Bathyarchaeota archaeon]|nr:hypothetical protein [Candidatus Bathyarchaeota archaeon]